VVHWLPSLNPIAGHVWLLRHVPFGDPYPVAEADAPYQVAGKVHVPGAEQWYKMTVLDWWPLAWGAHPVVAAAIASVFAALLGFGGRSWWRRVRAARAGDDARA
jgi:hypothetical protein